MLLVYLILNALAIWGFFAATRKEELFNLEMAPLPEWLAKPLYNCPFCMSSVWGLAGFAFFINFPPFIGELWGFDWWYMPIYCMQLCGINYLILLFIGSNE
jgi:hypothetical protein